MKKEFKIFMSSVLGIVLYTGIIFAVQSYRNAPVEDNNITGESIVYENNQFIRDGIVAVPQEEKMLQEQLQLKIARESSKMNTYNKVQRYKTNVALESKKNNKRKLSRGGRISRGSSYLSTVKTLDWWESGSRIFSRGTKAEVIDIKTGKFFKVERTSGTNHADCETLTVKDTQIIKDIWGGFSWERRSVILNIDGMRLAASMSAMPHAGIDSAPALEYVDNRSGGYGSGDNLDIIKNNEMDGHFDIHFLHSTRHKDGREDPDHQAAIKTIMKKQ